MNAPELPQTLTDWLERIEACHPSEIELGLDRLKAVADRLPINLSTATRVIVAGTNGKGSTLAMLDSILRQQGVKTGVYTSPHFLRYNERISVSGQPIDDASLIRAFNTIEQAREGVPLTYFEYGTLAALLVFTEQQVDVALLEVGLGGRLDAVNIVDADIALVTTVALDHTDWLGSDREAIGFEKAGIYRAGKPALCGDPDVPRALIEHADVLSAPLLCNGRDYRFVVLADGWEWSGQSAQGMPLQYRHLPLPVLPVQNAALVLQALQFLPFVIHEDAIRNGFKHAQLTGRMQSTQLGELGVTLDVAHNPEAAAYLASRLEADQSKRPVSLILGMLSDKDIAAVVDHLKPVVEHWYPVTLDVPRGADADELSRVLMDAGVPESCISSSASVATAVAQVVEEAANSRVVIAGSFFTVADALALVSRQGVQ
ncbi:bifunctional tetrahydrofolate synthase/dihydrofolate synthase [Marinobacterium weihaiense]|uniref:Dihydrofolate synthase/folylpolyglutamate synthase n=1 Tax=Marinobacterium weihaiense TaxID=2851016 RepID=A0ABS6M6Q4_9GAMM|nr:bifunctional tetrahydrofolate synthase/dihydrofolate synthase [Marinobacterium weihaiense]MBV0931915.1 bifunctional tetrahydrofolate synthase/dihydrofolate synthase [Marinobacterium weihaiense]